MLSKPVTQKVSKGEDKTGIRIFKFPFQETRHFLITKVMHVALTKGDGKGYKKINITHKLGTHV